MIVEKLVIFVEGLHARDAAASVRAALQRAAHHDLVIELAKLATKEQADVATLRGRLEGLSKRLAAANTDAKRKKDAYEAAAATAAKLEQEKKELHEHLAMCPVPLTVRGR